MLTLLVQRQFVASFHLSRFLVLKFSLESVPFQTSIVLVFVPKADTTDANALDVIKRALPPELLAKVLNGIARPPRSNANGVSPSSNGNVSSSGFKRSRTGGTVSLYSQEVMFSFCVFFLLVKLLVSICCYILVCFVVSCEVIYQQYS